MPMVLSVVLKGHLAIVHIHECVRWLSQIEHQVLPTWHFDAIILRSIFIEHALFVGSSYCLLRTLETETIDAVDTQERSLQKQIKKETTILHVLANALYINR